MGNMFDNYKNIPKDYIPNNSAPVKHYTNNCKRPLEEYDLEGNFIGFSWRYMDSIVLEFVTDGYVLYDDGLAEDAEIYMQGKELEISFYNFRYESIYSETIAASNKVKYYVGDKLKELLLPNTYAISVTLIDKEHNIRQTLLDGADVKIFVK